MGQSLIVSLNGRGELVEGKEKRWQWRREKGGVDKGFALYEG